MIALKSTLLTEELKAGKEAPQQENPAAKAKRLAEKSRFWLKEATAQRGGSEAFLLWLRSETARQV